MPENSTLRARIKNSFAYRIVDLIMFIIGMVSCLCIVFNLYISPLIPVRYTPYIYDGLTYGQKKDDIARREILTLASSSDNITQMMGRDVDFAGHKWRMGYSFTEDKLYEVFLFSEDVSPDIFADAAMALIKDSFVPVRAISNDVAIDLAELNPALDVSEAAMQRKYGLAIDLPVDGPLDIVLLKQEAINPLWFERTTANRLMERLPPNGRAATLRRIETTTFVFFWLPNPW